MGGETIWRRFRHKAAARARLALALMCSTQLPLVLAITALAISSGHMRPSTAAAARYVPDGRRRRAFSLRMRKTFNDTSSAKPMLSP